MSLVEKCWMITSNVSVITGICFGIFVRPYMKKKKEAIAVSTVYIAVMLVLYIVIIRLSASRKSPIES